MTTAARLLQTLRSLEAALQQPDVRADRPRVDALLHADYVEFGYSGRRYSRAEILERLASETAPADIRSQDFALRLLAPDVVLLTYRSFHRSPDKQAARHSLRASIWQLTEHGWQICFHQGTPTDPFEDCDA